MPQRNVQFFTILVLVSMFMVGLPRLAQASDVLADVNGIAISTDEVEKALGAPLTKLQEQLYAMKRQQLDVLIDERVLTQEAAQRGVSTAALLDTEVTAKVGLVTEREIDTIYETHKSQFTGDETTVRGQIRAHLQMQKLAVQRQAFLHTLRSQAVVRVYLQAPRIVRVAVGVDGAPFKGPSTAPVTIVKFEDFHCPSCQRIQTVFAELLTRYGDRVKLVHRDFPLDQLHPDAPKAHEAARCAHEQGRFWAYHDVLYSNPHKTHLANLKAYAKEAGLEVATFEQCVINGTYQEAVQRDVNEGTRLGVTGTPTFFINGRQVVGVYPVDVFTRLIDEELAFVQPAEQTLNKHVVP